MTVQTGTVLSEIFLIISIQMPGYVLKIGHDCFCSYPFNLSSPAFSYLHNLYSYYSIIK